MRSRLKRNHKELAAAIATVAGLAVADYGLSLAWHPLGIIVGGLEAAALAFLAGYSVKGGQ